MSVPVAAANFLLDKLSQIQLHKSNMIDDARDDLLRLEREVRNIKELMVEMCQYHSDSETLKQTVSEIRQLLYEAEDAVEEYLFQASVQKSRSPVYRVFHKFTDYPVMPRALEKQIASIAEKVKQINEDKLRTGFEVLQHLSIPKQDPAAQRPNARNVGTDCAIGFNGPVEIVAELLASGGHEDVEVISIAGMGGLGKTTLAKMVYKAASGDYDIRAFVHVSQEQDRKEALLRVLDCFTQTNDVKKMDEKKLEEHVFKQLRGKQYLVVLDDVWEAKDWDRWKRVFPANQGKKCRVLITTRNARVAEHVNPGNPGSLFRLPFLNEQQSCELLMKTVFPENDCTDDQRQHLKNISSRSKGLPMALVLIGGVLMNDLNPKWWKQVHVDLAGEAGDQVRGVMELAYEHLPNHLKPCFLYMGIFPDDFCIPVWKLVRLWASEGFIQEEGGDTLEDIAMNYLEQLVQRSLVMVHQRSSNGRVKYCRMHGLLRDFCKYKAVKENVYREVTLKNSNLDEGRRLCISANIMDHIDALPSGKGVRSFLTFVKEEKDVEPKTFSAIPKTFKLLRVLEAQSLVFSSFPTDLLYLFLLKYLAISAKISSLPPEFSALWDLQTLRVATTFPTLEIKADIWKMPHFRHFHSNVPATLPNPGTKSQKSKEKSSSGSNSSRSSPKNLKNKNESPSNSSNIQTLCTVAPDSCLSDVFVHTPKLKKLGISGTLSKLVKVNSPSSFLHLYNVESLENLKLISDQDVDPIPGILSHLPKLLTKLTLMKTRLEWIEMSMLGSLENLAVLKLKEFAFQGPDWHTEDGGFRSLVYLSIGHTDLKVWAVSEGHFPKLTNLKLDGCDEAIPLGLKNISSLQSVVVHSVAPSKELKALCYSPSSIFQLIQRI